MTTIVYHDGVMACDSQFNDNGVIVGHNTKIHTTRTFVLGMAGDADDREFAGWIKASVRSPKSLPTRKELRDFASEHNGDYVFILVFRNGQRVFLGSVNESDTEIYEVDNRRPAAIGSGAQFALGHLAFRQNGTAIDAVAAACRLDPMSGGAYYEEHV